MSAASRPVTLVGFMAFENGKPVAMELSDEIVCGDVVITNPFPVFASSDDARDTVLASQTRYGSRTTFEIREVTLAIGKVACVAEYDEDAGEDEDVD